MPLEIIHGPESYAPENYLCKDPACPVHGRGTAVHRPAPKPPVQPQAPADSIPEVHAGFSEVYSNKHEKILLRVEHIERMDAIRKAFNKSRIHAQQQPLTTSDIVTACLDFMFQHRIPFHKLDDAGRLSQFVMENVYREMASRWRQWTERF